VLDGQTWAEFYVVWCSSGETRGRHDPTAVRTKIDRLRAANGLPPITDWPEG
jgi:hypothetical protein